ncbi:MAG: serine/threonine-protein kinase [Ignavibacteria bacterium]
MSGQFGRYEVVSELGRGAMGVVYRANDPVLGRTVAVKTINLSIDPEERAEYEARFNQEAKAAGSLNHPAIVTIYDLGRTDNLAYMAMEFIEGREVKDLLSEGRALPPAQAISVAAQVAEGLAYAHQRGIVHRDIKPANIMVLASGAAKITDFGIARIQQSDVKTRTGVLLGSPKYMAPEQVLGQPIDHRADIFALGIVLYEMLTGKPPFAGNSLESLMYQTTTVDPPAPSRLEPALPEMLDLIVARALKKQPGDRYQDAAELAADLRDCERRYGDALASAATTRTDSGVRLASADDAAEDSGARGLSSSFDSFAATQKLARVTGMEREFDAFAATVKIARPANAPTATTAAPIAATAAPTTPPQPASVHAGRSRSELVLAGAILAAALLVAAFIAFY